MCLDDLEDGGCQSQHQRHGFQRPVISQTTRNGGQKAIVPALLYNGHHSCEHSAVHNRPACNKLIY